MNTLRNSVQLIGNIGLAPEIITFEDGTKLAKFNLATKEFYRKADGKMASSTEWHRLVAWGRNAELIEQYVKKGQKLTVEGKLCQRNYETKDGKKRVSTEIYVQKFLMLMKSKVAA